MACRMLDSFTNYTTAMILRKWDTMNSTPTIDNANGRYQNGCLSITNNQQGVGVQFDSQATWIMGIAIYLGGTPAQDLHVFSLRDGTNEQCQIKISMGLKVIVTSNSLTRATSTTSISTGTWFYLEAKIYFNGTGGANSRATVRINGTTDATIDGNTDYDLVPSSSNISADNFRLFWGTNNGLTTTRATDFYIFDGTGSYNNTLPSGACRVGVSLPAEPGNYAQFTATPEANFANVADWPWPDDDESFNKSSTANQIDSFKFQDAPIASGTVLAVQHTICARTDGGGTRTLAAFQRSGSSDYVETAQTVNSGSYKYLKFLRDTNPDTSAQYTASNFGSAEFGYKLIS